MSNKIELIRLCGVLGRNFLCLSQSDSQTQPCHVRMLYNVTSSFLASKGLEVLLKLNES